MGRGRPPVPQRVKELRGTDRADRTPKNEWRPTERARMPSWIVADELARAEWLRLAPLLEPEGLLTKADEQLFAAYCSAVGDIIRAARELRDHGLVVEGAKGGLVANPAANQKRQAERVAKELAAKFGLTPSDRSRLDVPKPEPEGGDAFEREFGVVDGGLSG